jgi:O-antigen/teichoic acid export membrane protein
MTSEGYDHTSPASTTPSLPLSRLFAFFLPLAGSALLVTLSHVIINSTLARAADPEIVIFTYAIAISLYAVLERPSILLRQTCSALVKDKASFRALWRIALIVIGSILSVSSMIAFTPLGTWAFGHIFGVDDRQMAQTIEVYQVLMFVTIFSGIRCVFHGIIISHMQTKWMTIGMIIRLIGMSIAALYFISTGVHSGVAGAIIFLIGMAIECMISVAEGVKLSRTLPEAKKVDTFNHSSTIFSFYRPLVLASIFAVAIGPLINAKLGGSLNPVMAIASYSVALTVGTLFISIASYTHQIVLNFYQEDARQVIRFATLTNLLPSISLGLLSFTAAGPWILSHIVGLSGPLLEESLWAMRGLVLLALIFPWVDYANGLLMLRSQTRVMTYSQMANISIVFISLLAMVKWVPDWNGSIGSLAMSFGVLAELCVLTWVLKTPAK